MGMGVRYSSGSHKCNQTMFLCGVQQRCTCRHPCVNNSAWHALATTRPVSVLQITPTLLHTASSHTLTALNSIPSLHRSSPPPPLQCRLGLAQSHTNSTHHVHSPLTPATMPTLHTGSACSKHMCEQTLAVSPSWCCTSAQPSVVFPPPRRAPPPPLAPPFAVLLRKTWCKLETPSASPCHCSITRRPRRRRRHHRLRPSSRGTPPAAPAPHHTPHHTTSC